MPCSMAQIRLDKSLKLIFSCQSTFCSAFPLGFILSIAVAFGANIFCTFVVVINEANW